MTKALLRGIFVALMILSGSAYAGCYRDDVIVCTAPYASITSPLNGAAVGAGAAFQVQVTGSDSGNTLSLMNKIELYRDGALVGTKTFTGTTSAAVVFDIAGLAKGTYVFQAKVYDSRPLSRLSQVVQVVAGGTATTIAANTTSLTLGQAVVLTATVSGGNPTGTVAFKDGSNVLQTVALSAGQAAWSALLSSGPHSITAQYSGDGNNYTSTSLPLGIVVTPTSSASITVPHLGNANAGTLPGKADVRGGKAGYALPLSMPPGVAGMVPSVALDYNGGTANGVVGVGWSLAASSSIHRCSPTISQDGRGDAIRLNGSDRLCLDGKRLNPSASNGTEYRTEIESFTRVVPTASGFTAYTRDGRIHYYGGTAETTREGLSGTTPVTHTWMLRRVEDRSGNAIDYSYSKDATTGEHLLTRIRWGANSAAGQAAFAKVDFSYEARADSAVAFIAGGRADVTQRLARITTWTDTAADGSGGTQAIDYTLRYHASPTSGRSLLESVQACSLLDGCLPATTFAWGEPDLSVARSFVHRGEWSGPGLEDYRFDVPTQPGQAGHDPDDMYISADFDGDGLNDLLTRYGDRPFTLYRNTGSGFTASAVFPGLDANYAVAESGDFDGDGQTDVLVAKGFVDTLGFTNANGRLSDWRICFSRYRQSLGFQCTAWPEAGLPAPNNNSSRLRYDFNADGRDDIYLTGDKTGAGINSSNHRMCLANGTGFTCSPVDPNHAIDLPGKELDPHTHFSTVTTDLDGDGRLDMLKIGFAVFDHELNRWLFEDRGIYAMSYNETGGPFAGPGVVVVGREIFSYGTPPEYQTMARSPTVGDLNGDGYSDLVFNFGPTLSAAREYRRCMGTGTFDVFCQPIATTFATANSFGQMADYDGDGSVEIPTVGVLAAGINDMVTCAFGGSIPQASNCATWIGSSLAPGVPPYDGGGLIAGEGNRRFAMDLTGDGKPDRVHYRTGGYWGVWELPQLARSGEALDRIVQVTNGLGLATRFEYAAPGDAAVYAPDATDRNGDPITFSYPQRRVPRMGHLVRALKVSNGQGGWIESRYAYSGAATDLNGRGHLGFARIAVTDVAAHITHTTWYSQTWPHIGTPVATQKLYTVNGVRLAETSTTLGQQVLSHPGGLSTRFTFAEAQQATKRDLNGSSINTSATNWTYGDGWGNPTVVSESVTGGGKTFSTTTTTTYQNDPSSWLIGLPTRTEVSKQRDGGVPVTRTSAASYEANGLPKTQTVEPDDVAFKVLTTFERNNPYGLVSKTTQIWSTVLTRNVSEVLSFDTKGRFALTVRNALGHTEQRSFDPRHGQPTSQTNANALTTYWTVDAFGRVLKEQRPDGTEQRQYLKQCDGNCPARATHAAITDSFQGGSRYGVPSLTYLDDAGRPLRSQTWGADGRAIVAEQRYDARGRAWEADHPRFAEAAPVLASRRGHDDLNRVTSVTVFDEANTERTTVTSYNGLSSTVTNPNGHQMTTVQDALGLLAQATDALNGITTYQRDPFGNLSQVTDPKGNVVQITYDRLGRRTDLRDPDLGWTHYDSDPLGRVWRQQSPKQRSAGQFTTFQFDALDRMTLRSEPDLTSTWVYDTAARGTGQLAEAYTGTPTNKDYRRVHGYDSLGRPSTTTITLDTSYVSTTHYDAQGRLSRLSHQRGTGPIKAYDHLYNPLGYLHRIERAGVGLWQASEQDAAQRTTVALLGNGLSDRQSFNPYSARLTAATVDVAPGQSRLIEGYTYDELGNVKQRTQWWDGSGFSESFDYDGLNRLKSAQVTGRALHSFGYDEIGNLVSKTGAGSGNYVYPTSGANAVRPHAVQSIPGLGIYGYDANGNLTSAPSGAVLTWKSFDMPDTITRGGVSSQFAYGPEHQRGRQTRSDGTVLYYAGAMEVETKAGASTVKTYWPLGLGVEIDKPGQATEMLWTHSDRLGSVIGLTNSAGGFKEKLAYDAWGKRRTLDGASTPNTLDGQADNRGFTGHEMLDNLDMVHMNGRIYEPGIARFVSADPLIQDPEHSQSYNRYSYVWNNPTNLTDPTGFAAGSWEKRFGKGEGWRTLEPADGSSSEFVPENGARTQGNGLECRREDYQGGGSSPPGQGAANGTVNLSKGDITQSSLAGLGNSAAKAAVGFANLMISIGDIGGNAELIGPWQPFAPKSNYFGAQGEAVGDGLQAVAGARALGQGLAGAVEKSGTKALSTASVPTTAAQEMVRVGELIPTHGKTMSNNKLSDLVKRIRAEGIKEPLTVIEHQGKLYIVDGHHRALAAPRAGIAQVPIRRVELPYGAYKTADDLTYTPGGY